MGCGRQSLSQGGSCSEPCWMNPSRAVPACHRQATQCCPPHRAALCPKLSCREAQGMHGSMWAGQRWTEQAARATRWWTLDGTALLCHGESQAGRGQQNLSRAFFL